MLVVVRVELHRLHIAEGVRETNVVAVAAVGDGHVVVLVETGAEHLVPLVAANGFVLAYSSIEVGEFSTIVARTVAVARRIRRRDGVAVAVNVICEVAGQGSLVGVVFKSPVVKTWTEIHLHVGHIGNLVPTDIGIEVYTCTSSIGTFLGGDHHNTIVTLGTIQGRSRSTFQNGDALDVLGVDVNESVCTDALVVPVAFVVGVAIANGHTVHDDERLGVTRDRGESTHSHRHGRDVTTGSGLHAHTCSLTIHSGGEIRRACLDKVFGFHLAHCVTHLSGIFLDTEGGHDDFTQAIHFFRHHNLHVL